MRDHNEDAYLADDRRQVYAVADGLGGHQGGETASAMAIAAILDTLTHPSAEKVRLAMDTANHRINDRASQVPELSGMGSTLCVLAVVAADDHRPGRLVCGNVGDSRLYLLTRGSTQITQITNDHSLVAELVRLGEIDAAAAARHPHRNVLTHALGTRPTITPDLFELLPVTGDRYLLCSDGLHGLVDNASIARVLIESADGSDAAGQLVKLASEAGGIDNVTAVVVDILDAAATNAAPTPSRVLTTRRSNDLTFTVNDPQ